MASKGEEGGIIPSPGGPFGDGAGDQAHQDKVVDQLLHDAKNATEKERGMTFLQGVRLYPKAVAWSILISTTIVMEGYDVCLINNFCESCHAPLPTAYCPSSC